MNTHKFKFILLLVLGLGLPFTSCKDYLDVNIDPNQSTTSRIDLQLSSAQLEASIGIGQRIYPQLSILCQYQTGGPGVSLGDPDQHKWASSEGNELFTRLYRSNVNLDFIIKTSTELNYVAIAKIMKAYNFQVCADIFGDIPYAEALKGDIADGSIVHPKYDSAKDVVYPALEKELKEAIDLISRGGTFIHPGADDLIYHGDMVLWDKFAHTLLLKMYLRQGAAGQAKLAALYSSDDQFVIETADEAKVSFPGGATGSNPSWTAANSTSLGNFYVATTTFLDYLSATQDPRIDAYFDPTPGGTHAGLNPGDIQNAPINATFSRPAGAKVTGGGLMFSPTAPVFFISAWEGNLLLAEAAARGWITSDVDALYAAGVHASFEYLGLDATAADDYLAAGGAIDASNKIKSIALQKWTCMNNLQPVESWIETRRLDSPATPIFASAGGIFKSPTLNALGTGVFPSILPYPENEESLNQSFPGQHPLTAKVFWDN
ncbi:MAG: SusD/RagB family nutrient-binding outer membrane lipoprotein [Saprospiraceae bacterium]|nr:SusD/RagB family nutrient-binding outer membrane lipoprotein [Saprospiraceae bacterium]